jgi:hypothetical protein
MITNNDTTNRRGGGWGISFSLCPSAGRKNPEDKSFLIVDVVKNGDVIVGRKSDSKERELCPKCFNLMSEDGLCWKCLTESPK